MVKGLFTQGICVLLERPVELERVEAVLNGFEVVGRHEGAENEDPASTLILKFRPEVEGHVLVSLSNNPWPDDMGDPDEAPELFVAWSLGQFGPLAFPGCLVRAGEQSWEWEAGQEAAGKHRAHIRVLTSYVLGTDDVEDDGADMPLTPTDYDSVGELQYLMKVITPLLELPEAICYFNPAGEVLRDESGLRQGLNHAWVHDMPPIDMWTNIRLFKATDHWTLMDTVGNGQMDQPDMEAVFFSEAYNVADVADFLRNATLFVLRGDEVVEDGDTADGPGGLVWKVLECDDALADPPRPTLRWFPCDDRDVPPELLDTGISEDEEDYDEDDQDFDDEFDDDPESKQDLEGELRALGDDELDDLLGDDDDSNRK